MALYHRNTRIKVVVGYIQVIFRGGQWVGVGQSDDLTAGVGVSYDPLSHFRHNGEV